ncbi:MAG: hypothetical protein HQK78_19625, partial [Desulfobacterales bacterium]|nr:hypothetical protein [Desulfobacterales bacterium]
MDKQYKIQIKLAKVYSSLGISYSDAIGIILVTDRIDTACWGIDQFGKEYILINPEICLSYTVSDIVNILRHEFLHRGFYNGFYEKFKDNHLANIVLDIVVNKILYTGNPDEIKNLSKKIYPQQSNNTLIALANCIIVHSQLSPPLDSLHSSIWNRKEIPNPSSLYYKLYKQRKEYCFRFYGEPVFIDVSNGTIKNFSKLSYNQIKKGRGTLNNALNSILKNMFGDAYNKMIGGFEELIEKFGPPQLKKHIDALSNFISRQKIMGELCEAAGKLKSALISTGIKQAYPFFLSRTGIIYKALGISDVIHCYWNRDRLTANVKIAIYIDSSGSMTRHLPKVLCIIEQIEPIEMEVFFFDVNVYPSSIKDIAKGKVIGNGGTDFSAPVKHFSLSDNKIQSAIFFTDGESELSAGAENSFINSRKKVYVVFFNNPNYKHNV